MSKKEQTEDLVRSAGRGAIYIAFAKVWFMIAGWALIFGLPRIFKWTSGGDEDQGVALFGAYKLVFMGVSFINNGIITGTIQAVSKFTSEDESQAGAVRRAGLRVQGMIGVCVAVLYIGFAGIFADLLGSPDLAFLMRLSAGVIVAYSIYAVFIGSFNGQRQFGRQALFDISYNTLKPILIVSLAAAGFEVLGAVVGFLTAAVVIATAAGVVSGWGKGGSFPAKRYLSFGAHLLLYTFVLNLVLSLDLFLLKGISAKLAILDGITPEAASELSKRLAGLYGAAQGLGFIPYQGVIAIAFVAFPMISKVTFNQDAEKTKAYIRTTMRFTAIFIVGVATVFASIPTQALGLVFPETYVPADDALRMLSFGIMAFGLMVLANTILNSAGYVKQAIGAIVITLCVLVTAVVLSLMNSTADVAALEATAKGTLIGMTFGLALSGVLVYRKFGTFWPWITVIKVAVASALTISLASFLPNVSKLVTLGEAIAVFVFYFVILVLLREFGADDLNRIKRVLGKKSA